MRSESSINSYMFLVLHGGSESYIKKTEHMLETSAANHQLTYVSSNTCRIRKLY